MIVLQLIIMFLIPIILLFLGSYLSSKLWDSDITAWVIAPMLYIIWGFFIIGGIALECFLYYRWFA